MISSCGNTKSKYDGVINVFQDSIYYDILQKKPNYNSNINKSIRYLFTINEWETGDYFSDTVCLILKKGDIDLIEVYSNGVVIFKEKGIGGNFLIKRINVLVYCNTNCYDNFNKLDDISTYSDFIYLEKGWYISTYSFGLAGD